MKQKKEHALAFANFWPRFFAINIDQIILFPLIYGVLASATSPTPQWVWASIFLALWVLYKPLCEYFWSATLGKRIAKIKVVASHGGRPNLAQIFLRNLIYMAPLGFSFYTVLQWATHPAFAQIDDYEQFSAFLANPSYTPWAQGLYSLLFYANILCLLFDKYNRALHDFIAGTLVIKN